MPILGSSIGFGASGGGGGPRRCSFCSRREAVVEHLVRASGVYICDSCVALAQAAIEAAPGEQKLLRIRPSRGAFSPQDVAGAEIELAIETVFSGDSPDEARCGAIEQGGNLGPSMRQVRERYGAFDGLDVMVESVRFLDDDEAEVRFALVRDGGRPLLNETGHAVRTADGWKLARHTWCRMVAMVGVQCPPPEDASEPGT